MYEEVPITLCRRCNRNTLLEYWYEVTCLVCEFNVIKQKKTINQISKKKKSTLKGD